MKYQLVEQILIPLRAGFSGFNAKGGVSLPKLLVDFNRGLSGLIITPLNLLEYDMLVSSRLRGFIFYRTEAMSAQSATSV